MIKVAFVCVHNSCRSQIAEAFSKSLANTVFEAYSAGTALKDRINQDAQRLMHDNYGIDMQQTQYSKLLSDLPPVDIVITMGCHVTCPILPNQYTEDWGLTDPTGESDEVFIKTIELIKAKVLALMDKIESKSIQLKNKA